MNNYEQFLAELDLFLYDESRLYSKVGPIEIIDLLKEITSKVEALKEEYPPINERAVVKQEFPNGLTVSELQNVVSKWSVINSDMDSCEVWIETSKGLSSQVKAIYPLNRRVDSLGIVSADLILEA